MVHVTISEGGIAINGNQSGAKMVDDFIRELRSRANSIGGVHMPLTTAMDHMS